MPTTQFQDYYQTLGVDRKASADEIKRAYRKLARRYHPDATGNDAAKSETFKRITEAYEVLKDPERRSKYDELGSRWPEYEQWERAGKPGPDPFAAYASGGTAIDLEDLLRHGGPSGFGGGFSDFFETFFASQPGGGRTSARGTPPRPARGHDAEVAVALTLAEAISGTARTIELSDGGRARRVEVRIPAGVADGARIRATGQGGAGRGGGPRGDLYVRVSLAADPRYRRDGDTLHTRVNVPLRTALLGGTVAVTTPLGRQVQLTVPAETQNGTRLRLRGLGMPHVHGEGHGDLMVEVFVRLPLPLSAGARAAAESL